ncbi:MAG: DUF1566 domain-containing protein [Candidatus Competibacteraceae bacterium]
MSYCLPHIAFRRSFLAALLLGLTAFELAAAPLAPIAPIITSAATRFTDNSNGTMTDSITGLIWLKDANCVTVSPKAWAAALTAIATLASPSCGLSDGSTTGQWRLPSRNELQSLIDYTTINPALPAGHPFTGVQSRNFQSEYWSSTASTIYAPDTRYAWLVRIHDGNVYWVSKIHDAFVWPVRGGL